MTETILVVDDSPTILKVVQLALTKAEYRVVTASDGQAALLAAKEERPGLILLDYMMPEVNGEDVCRVMSVDLTLSTIPVVVMSAPDEAVKERFAGLSNVVDHITKPFSQDAIVAVVGHVLSKQAQRNEAPANDTEPLRLRPPTGETETAAPAAETASGDSALAGDLATIAIADVLTMLADQGQTGVLALARANTRLDVFLQNGRIDFATARNVPDEFLLGRFLVRAGALTHDALTKAIERRKKDGATTLLGADLMKQGLVTETDLRKAMSFQTTALVYEGLRWGAGRFTFVASAKLPAPAIEAALSLPVDALVMEGLRRVDEWRLIEREVGDFDRVFVRNEDKIASFGRLSLLREELTVLDLVNGRNTVRELTGLSKMGSFDVMKMLYRLLRNKLIRRRLPPVAAS